MGAEHRHVRCMTLTAPRREAVRRLMPDIEDAFRTATLPGEGRGGVLLVRRLDLGTIAPGTTRQALARRIGEAARASGAVTAGAAAPVPADAPVLFWPDRVEMLAAALLAVSAGGGASWWVAAVLGARPGLAAPEAASRAALRLLRATGPEAVGALVLRLFTLGAPPRAMAPLATAIEAAAAVLEAETGALHPAGHGAERRAATAGPGRRGGQPMPPATHAARPVAPTLWAALPLPLRRAAAALRDAGTLSPAAHEALAPVLLARLHGRGALAAFLRTARAIAADAEQAGPPYPATQAAPSAPGPAPAGREHPAGSAGRPRDASQDAMPRAGPAMAHAPTARPLTEPIPGLATGLGGLPLLVNLVRLAGLEPLDALLETDLCAAVLRRLPGRAAPDDPVRAALPDAAAPPPNTAAAPPFRPDPRMLAASGLRFGLAPAAGRPGLRLLREARTGLPLALLDRAGVAAIAAAAGRDRLGRAAAGPAPDDLVAGLTLALRLAMKHLTGRPWRAAVLRPGRAMLSATHLDVTLDLDDVRLAERRAGLDLTPGWVPWLGLVVTLHFERFGQGGTGLPP